jgi:two-component system response regulator PilR (NtrC family)
MSSSSSSHTPFVSSGVGREIIGTSKAVKAMNDMIARVAPAKTNILVTGESGTGKELVARMIHELGPLKGKPFIPVNCGAIPENLIESEMFGHKRGSFTGAVSDKVGLFEAANGGTLFLDEVGELPLAMQVKLLRAIQERSFRKVGGNDDVKVELRIIAATNRDLEAGIAAGTFREDLYYRLNVILIKTPPLRERKGDVKILAERFLTRALARAKKTLTGFDADAMAAIEGYAWPGNVRELENVIERAVTLETSTSVTLAALPEAIKASAGRAAARAASAQEAADTAAASGGADPAVAAANALATPITLPAPDFSKGKIDLDQILAQVERVYLIAALDSAGRSKARAADLLGITSRSIRYRLQKLGMSGAESDSDD